MVMRVVRCVMHVDAFEQQLDLRRRERQSASAVFDGGSFGHREGTLLQALRTQPEPRAIPRDQLHPVLVLAHEDEDIADVRIVAQRMLHHRRQRGAAFAHVGRLAGEEYPPGVAERQHAETANVCMTSFSKS